MGVDRKAKLTYANVAKEDICLYPKAGEGFFADQIRTISQVKFLEIPVKDANAQDAGPQSQRSSRQLSVSRREELAKAKQPASSPPSATYTHPTPTMSIGDSGKG